MILPNPDAMGDAASADPWKALLGKYPTLPHQTAHAMRAQHGLADWTASFAPFNQANAWTEPNSAQEKVTFMRSIFDSLQTTYFLVVRGTKVHVWYALKSSHHYTHAGQRALGLLGDHTMRPNGLTVPPKLYKVEGNIDAQAGAFTRTAKTLLSWEAIAALLASDTNLQLVPAWQAPAAEGGEGGEAPPQAPPNVTVWKIMPIHPKFAHLFLGGLSVRAAFSLIEGIVAAAPDDVRTGLKLLQEWIRAAVTQADGGTESLLHSALSCVPTQAETAQALEGWYYDLVEIHAPVVSAGTPSGGSVGGGGSRSAVPPPPNPTDATEKCAPRFPPYTATMNASL